MTLRSGARGAWEDPFSGAVAVFRCKRIGRIKILVWYASGLLLVCGKTLPDYGATRTAA